MTNFDKILREFEKYDYHETVFADAKEATAEWLDYHRQDVQDSDSIEDLESDIYDALFVDDSVTGNGSGSYWFSSWKAEIALVGNSNLYMDALEEFGGKFEESPEIRDVTIRCYLLSKKLSEILEDEEIIKIYNEIKGV